MRPSFFHLVLSTALFLSLSACGGFGKSQITSALNESFADDGVCWSLRDMDKATFPIRTLSADSGRPDKILQGLSDTGFIEIGEGREPMGFSSVPVMVISLTEKGLKAGVWDRKKGFCVGNKRVVEVMRFSEPSEQMGMRVSQVEYKWAIKDTPSWIETDAFSEVEGMSDPVDGVAVLQEMSDGWQVVH